MLVICYKENPWLCPTWKVFNSATPLQNSYAAAYLFVIIRETTLFCKHPFANKDRLGGIGVVRYWGSVYAKFFYNYIANVTITISPNVHSKNYTCSSLTERTHDVIITLLLRQNYVAISFCRNNFAIMCPLEYVLFCCGVEIFGHCHCSNHAFIYEIR